MSILAQLLGFIVIFILNFYRSTYVLFSVIGAIQIPDDDDDDDDDDKFIRTQQRSRPKGGATTLKIF